MRDKTSIDKESIRWHYNLVLLIVIVVTGVIVDNKLMKMFYIVLSGLSLLNMYLIDKKIREGKRE
ncbi:MAG: hypothetical protein ACRDB0_06110 [Paraclostridium sp.]